MIRHAQQAVRVGRQIDADHVGALIGHHIKEPRVLMREAVVILPPYKGGDEDVYGGNRSTPAHLLLRLLQPFGVLVEHGIDHVYEGFISRKKAVTTREHVTFEPALERVLTQHLHHASEDVKLPA